MKRAVGMTVVAASLTAMLSASSPPGFEHAPRPDTEVRADQLSTPSPKTTANLGKLSLAKTKPRPMTVETAPPLLYTPVSPEVLKQNTQNARYVGNVLLPAIQKHGQSLEVVTPINTKQDPVNTSGQFIVATRSDPTCGSQFHVGTQTNEQGKITSLQIDVDVFGKRTVIRDGNVYGRAAYTPNMGLAHAESDLDSGVTFSASSLPSAINYIADTTIKVCHLPAVVNELSK